MATATRALTPRQAEVHRLLYESMARDGFKPTDREVAASLGISQTRAVQHFESLVESGYLEGRGDVGRGGMLVRDPDGRRIHGWSPVVGPAADIRPGGRPVTRRQAEILRAIIDHVRTEGHQPSYRDLARRFGFAFWTGVTSHIRALARKGYVETAGTKERSIRILRDPDGRPVAGWRPVYADEPTEEQ